MLRPVFVFIGIITLVIVSFYARLRANETHRPRTVITKTATPDLSYNYLALLKTKAPTLKMLAKKKGYSSRYGFMIDMNIPSGKKRFFVYDLQADTVMYAGLVAHGSCNQDFRSTPYFSNTPNTGCSSDGIYKVGYRYRGLFGRSYKLHGLDSSNSNAFNRNIVLHAYDCVPDEEIYPESICNSLGCPMVSYNFRNILSSIIDRSDKPILLWIIPTQLRPRH